MSRKKLKQFIIEAVGIIAVLVIFGIPFYYVLINSTKSMREAAQMNISLPETFLIVENYTAVLETQNGIVIRAFMNSMLITFMGVFLLVVVGSMTGFVLSRRRGRDVNIIAFVILAGLMIPPAIVPTIWVLDGVGLFRTLQGLVMVQVALNLPFATILYRAFIASIPREVDESAMIEGSSPIRLYLSIILPLLKPVTSTVVVISAVTIFNDFMNPLYFLPGVRNVTVQLTLYNFMSQFATEWHLLFANVVLITLPPLILFIFFNKKIVSGMTAGAVKG